MVTNNYRHTEFSNLILFLALPTFGGFTPSILQKQRVKLLIREHIYGLRQENIKFYLILRQMAQQKQRFFGKLC